MTRLGGLAVLFLLAAGSKGEPPGGIPAVFLVLGALVYWMIRVRSTQAFRSGSGPPPGGPGVPSGAVGLSSIPS